MSSADVIDALFVKTVDMVQSLPKSGPIQTSYEEKLALYSLYKQATEGDVRSARPGLLDMLGRAKWDAWAKVRGLPQRDAKQMYVESMLRILRRFSDRPQAVALIQELENFSGQVAQRVMDGSLAHIDSDDGDDDSLTEGESESDPDNDPLLLHHHHSHNQQPSQQPLPPSSSSRLPASTNTTTKTTTTTTTRHGSHLAPQSHSHSHPHPPPSITGTSTAATRGGVASVSAVSPGRTPIGSDDSDIDSDDDERHDSIPHAHAHASAPSGPFRSTPRYQSRLGPHSNSHHHHHHHPPASTTSSRAYQRPASVSGATPGGAGVSSPPLASSSLPQHQHQQHQHPRSQHHQQHPHSQPFHSAAASVAGSAYPQPQHPSVLPYQRSTYAASSVGGRSVRTPAHPAQPPQSGYPGPHPRPPSVSGASLPPPPAAGAGAVAPASRPEMEMALQSIQASLAALHERLNQVESRSASLNHPDDNRRRAAPPGRSRSSGSPLARLGSALSNVLHDFRLLLGLTSAPAFNTYPNASGRSSPSNPSDPSNRSNSNQNRNTQTHADALAPSYLAAESTARSFSSPITWLLALLQLVARLTLDVVSAVLVSSVVLFAVRKVTGRGDPLLLIRYIKRFQRLIWLGAASKSKGRRLADPVTA
ncbi:ACBP-domain-containing protein [Testicularia cyperi]|uniref:ACBP-domain-containing protein n=1 Tax=Testicularia cyperi TaxID=1882483 RepID=A0A317XK22_9BASI|nr:ACBP-domain-containing protein [Testicularia cyperi]